MEKPKNLKRRENQKNITLIFVFDVFLYINEVEMVVHPQQVYMQRWDKTVLGVFEGAQG